jgi:DNA polymerase-3 subunit alpha
LSEQTRIANELAQQKEYKDFLTLFRDIKLKTSVNNGKLETLIKLNFFREFGGSNYLLGVMKIFEEFSTKKQINKNKLDELGLKEEIIKKYSNKETKSLFKEIDNEGLMNRLISQLENKETPLKDIIKAEVEYLGYPDTKLPTLQEPLYYVLDIVEYKNKRSSTYYPVFYNIKTGETIKYKVGDYMTYVDYPFVIGDIIIIEKEHTQNKKRLDKETGKWIVLQNEFNNIIDWWTIY